MGDDTGTVCSPASTTIPCRIHRGHRGGPLPAIAVRVPRGAGERRPGADQQGADRPCPRAPAHRRAVRRQRPRAAAVRPVRGLDVVGADRRTAPGLGGAHGRDRDLRVGSAGPRHRVGDDHGHRDEPHPGRARGGARAARRDRAAPCRRGGRRRRGRALRPRGCLRWPGSMGERLARSRGPPSARAS